MTTTTCTAVAWRRQSKGILSKGTETFTTRPVICGRRCDEGHDLCNMHLAAAAKLSEKLAAKKAAAARKAR